VPVRTEDLATRAYTSIREAILDLSFEPGQYLQESYLAQWLGMSRTPVREALRRLQSEGLIETSSRGVIVAQISIDDVENAYYIIEVLEGLFARLAAERLTPDSAHALRRVTDQLAQAGAAADLEGWLSVHSEFHSTIYAIAANPKLAQTTSLIYSVIERVRHLYLREGSEADRIAVATQDHCRVGEAVLRRDATAAEQLARKLFADARMATVRLLRHWIAPLRRSF